MQLQWLGLASFRIQTQQSTIITDPYADSFGVTMPKMKADIIMVSDLNNPLTNNTKRLSGEAKVISGPGEYEILQTFIYGIPAANHTVYLIEDNDISLAVLGPLDTGLNNDQLSKLEGVDIIVLPIGTLNKEQRTVIVSQVEPRIIIPSLYTQPKVKLPLESLDVFLKEMGIKRSDVRDKLVVKAKDLPQADTSVIVLSPTSS